MTTLREAAQQALQALEDFKRRGHWGDFDNLTGALKAALEADDGMYGAKALTVAYENGWNAAKAEPVQEPVANDDKVICPACCHQFRAIPPNVQQMMLDAGFEPPFTAPPQRKPLTEEEIDSIWDSEKAFADIYAIARAIERAHGIDGAPEERNFCPRCGKRTNDIHTCTPPAPLTNKVIADLWHQNGGFHHHFARAIERWLKGNP